MKLHHKLALFTLATLVSLHPTRSLWAQGSAFTYQGRLNDGVGAANGFYDLRASLYDAPASGNRVGTPLTNAAVLVSNGLFTVRLDFGPGIFIGPDRWLELAVRTNGSGAFVALSPLQALTPTPYALFATTANNVSGRLASSSLAGTYGNALNLNNPANAFRGSFSGDGAALTNVNAATLNGLSIQQNTNGAPNVIGGSPYNFVSAGVVGATIGGGGATNYGGVAYTNSVGGDFGTVGGGSRNTASSGYATVSGGYGGTASGAFATVGGGVQNTASGLYTTVAGGYQNTASVSYATVGGGYSNTVSGYFATVDGGYKNTASGDYSFAGGQQAQAQHQGAFVWADSQNAPFASTNNDSFNVRARGGVRLVTAGTGLTVDGQPVLTTGSSGSGLSIQQNASGAPNVIGGSPYNVVAATVVGATIGGGGATNYFGTPYTNSVSGNFGTVGGGRNNTASGFAAAVGGGDNNTASGSYAAVGAGIQNTASGYAATVAGGIQNTATVDYATVGGGGGNTAVGSASAVAGGQLNTASGDYATVSGGLGNIASAYSATVAGGYYNTASSVYATVGGGRNNTASGSYSFAAGRLAQAAHQGAFVWADSQGTNFTSTANDQFLLRAQGGVGIDTATTVEGGLTLNTLTYLDDHPIYLRGRTGVDHNHGLAYNGGTVTNFGTGNVQVDGPVLWGFNGGALGVMSGGAHAVLTWTNGGATVNGGFSYGSDRHIKSGFSPLDAQQVLQRVAALPLSSWAYTNDLSARHIGPMAQDFHAAFQLDGNDDTHINIGDETGVALAAIQGLNQQVQAQAAALKAKDAELERLKQRLERLEQLLSARR